VKLAQIDREIPELEAKAESVMTPERLKATQERNAREIREREETAERGHLGQILSEAILRYRGEEFTRLGVVPDASGRVQLERDRLIRAVNEAEAMLAQTGVCAEDAYRTQQLVSVYGAGKLLSMTYDEASREYLGKPAREIRDEALDRFLGIAYDAERGQVVDPALVEGEEEPDVA
jgi:hypothetical protein